MNRSGGRRSLRTLLAGWLRALLRRLPGEGGPDPSRQDAELPEPARSAAAGEGLPRADAALPTGPGPVRRSGPPEHWLALARSQGPPRHWLELIRARLGDDLSKVPWIRARVAPPRGRWPAAPRMARPPADGAVRPQAPVSAPPEADPGKAEPAARLYPVEQPAPERMDREVVRRPPVALRLYPAAAGEKPVGRRPQTAPPPETQPEEQPAPHSGGRARPVHEESPAPIRRAVAPLDREAPQAPAAPLPPLVPARPFRAQSALPPEAGYAPPLPAVQPPADREAEPGPREQDSPWPDWQAPAFTLPVPPPAGVASGPPRPEPRFTAAPRQPAPSQWPHPLPDVHPPPAAPDVWRAAVPAPVERREEREQSSTPLPFDKWSELPPPEDDDLAGDEWEVYQRNWQRLERLRREQQGQLWNEWPF